MSSTRLPGKVLMPLAGAPMILRQIERVNRCRRIDRLVVATSDESSDDPLDDAVASAGADVFRGPLNDVLGRFIGAMDAFGPAQHVVRLTGDCPLADWSLIDTLIERHLASDADHTCNTLPRRSFPKGLDAEVIRAGALAEAAAESADPYEREHVTPFIYRRPERFRLEGLDQAADESELRWTVDLPEDYAFVAEVYAALYPANPAFTSDDVRAFCRERA